MIMDGRSSGWTPIQVKEVGVIDLTAAFGEGNELSKELMDELLSRCDYHVIGAYPAGALSRYNFDTFSEDIEALETYTKERLSNIDGIEDVPFELGDISMSGSGWTYTVSLKKVRTPEAYNLHLGKGSEITFGDEVEGYIGWKLANGTYEHSGSWKRGTYVTIAEGDFAIVARYITQVDITNVSAVADEISVYNSSNPIAFLESLQGEGNTTYIGEKITLGDDLNENKCDIELWKDFKGDEISDLASYNLYKNQSMAIYNGYVFLFNEGGGGIVLDYSTKAILGSFASQPTSYQHQNSAQFTNIYYNDTDEFPLLLISRCGNAGGADVSGYDECLIYRVTRSDSSFTFTLVNSIEVDFETHGISWGVDNNTNLLYAVAYTVDGYWTTTNNPISIFAWEMPSKSDILSGSAITLSNDYAIEMQSDFVIFQGMMVKGGKVYMGLALANSVKYVFVYEPSKGKITAKIPLISQLEPEGMAIYDGKMFITQKNGGDTSGANPLKIYELNF